MDKKTIAVVEECTRISDDQSAKFPEIVGKLMAAGVERYHADLIRADKTYYMTDGNSHITPCHKADSAPATAFSPSGVEVAVRASQNGQIQYREFCERIAKAGCVGYFVTLAGRRAIYYGRTGETHVEMFPGAT
jgi:uncharacterized protein YbcV (DUF1398 family)